MRGGTVSVPSARPTASSTCVMKESNRRFGTITGILRDRKGGIAGGNPPAGSGIPNGYIGSEVCRCTGRFDGSRATHIFGRKPAASGGVIQRQFTVRQKRSKETCLLARKYDGIIYERVTIAKRNPCGTPITTKRWFRFDIALTFRQPPGRRGIRLRRRTIRTQERR